MSKKFQFLSLLIVTSVLVSYLPLTSANDNVELIYTDGRISGIYIEEDQTFTESWSIKKDEWYSVIMDCQSCVGTISLDGTIIDTSSSDLTGQSTDDSTIQLTIESSLNEQIGLSIIHNVTDEYYSLRPSPNQQVSFVDSKVCTELDYCQNYSRGNINSIPNGELSSPSFIRGIIDSGQNEFFAINVSEGDTLELSLSHYSSNIRVEVFFQNLSSEVLLDGNLSQNNKMVANQQTQPTFWYFEDDGRAVVKVQSSTLNTVWSLQSTVFKSHDITTISELNSVDIYGHHEKIIIIEAETAERINLFSPLENITIDCFQLIDGNWSLSDNIDLQSNVKSKIYVYPNVEIIRLKITGIAFFIEVSSEDYSDTDQGIEAPSLTPIFKATDNSSWPTINIGENSISGQFTLPIFDYSDVYKFEITAWEDSIHFVKFTVEGDIADCEVELIEKNQETWENKETKVRTLSSGKIEVALEVERGTHFLRISIINSSTFNHSWGEEIDSKNYTISTYYELVDEGEEPWFPPDDNAKKWGELARWFMGLLFLVPALIVFVMYRKNSQFAASLLEKKMRLNWLKSRLDSGTTTPKEGRRFLRKALNSLSTLEWEEACQIWGEYDIQYRTEGVALVAWKLDERISEKTGSWPIIIGINILQGNWELAALRLDSPEGEAWNITNVHPKFLANGEEIFLDSMVEGNMTFLTIELEGNSKSVDIEINGRVDGKPYAARIPSTLWRQEIDSEE
ncbi:MAG: hypothetical protein CBE08_003990 [Euryarchaeota archaeon TMED248]|nr:MAG: hypothetical protein CBE08_003990 [Euryarchaeota archaeon TMED248]